MKRQTYSVVSADIFLIKTDFFGVDCSAGFQMKTLCSWTKGVLNGYPKLQANTPLHAPGSLDLNHSRKKKKRYRYNAFRRTTETEQVRGRKYGYRPAAQGHAPVQPNKEGGLE